MHDMNIPIIKSRSIWTYIGPGDGRGKQHVVLTVEPHEVVTWEKLSANVVEAGMTWLGDQTTFRSHFRPA